MWLCLISIAMPALAEIRIDGQLVEPEWREAKKFSTFIQSFPNTGEKPKYPTTTYLLTNEQGIYVAFENFQPARSRKYSGHDQYTSADFNMVFIDFNGDGDTAYEFVATLGGGTMDGTYSRGNQSNRDWDGNWQVQVSEKGNYWYSEFFIPWTTATYRAIEEDEREISVYFQRQNVIDSEAYSFPDTNRARKNFTYEFAPVTVKNVSGQSLDSTVYVANRYDLLSKKNNLDVGVDITWKPHANQQIITTVNPDFGQVESDELIVNYSAVETLRTDKRPFFTVNQGLFDIQGPNNLKLVNTRRIGANAQLDTNQVHDITAAGKYIYNGDVISSGLLFAQERDAVENDAKSFISGRLYSNFQKINLGQTINYVYDPLTSRNSYVFNQDVRYMPSEQLNLFANFVYSHNTDESEKKIGKGATLKVNYVPIRHWQSGLEWTYFDDQLDINDFGYQERNNISTIKLESQFDDYQIDKRYNILRTRTYGRYTSQRNTQGLNLRDSLYGSFFLQLKGRHNIRIGANHISQGADDLITRQIGHVEMPSQNDFHIYYGTPTPATFSFNATYHYFQEGLSDWSKKLLLNTRSYLTDNVRLDLNYTYIDSNDWLIGKSNGEVERYARILNKVYAKLIAKIDESSDFTLSTQWFGLKAYGRAVSNSSFKHGDDFNVSQFSLQARYRKKFDSGSSFYLVYAHNGSDYGNENSIDFNQMASNAIASPKQKSITAKLNWLF